MKSMNLWLSTGMGLAISFGLAGCAGTITTEEQERLRVEHAVGAGGSTGTSTGTSGAGGSGPLLPVTTCVMTSMKGCSGIGCHSKTGGVGNLNLSFEALTTNYKTLYYDKPNAGIGDADPKYCQPGVGKLVDSVNPTQSLIYTKTLTTTERDAMMKAPCGDPMPSIGMVTDADKMCILTWINDVIKGSKAP